MVDEVREVGSGQMVRSSLDLSKEISVFDIFIFLRKGKSLIHMI